MESKGVRVTANRLPMKGVVGIGTDDDHNIILEVDCEQPLENGLGCEFEVEHGDEAFKFQGIVLDIDLDHEGVGEITIKISGGVIHINKAKTA